MLDSANLSYLAGELAASRLGLGLLYLPASCVLVPCQLYLHLVATRHYRTIQQVNTDTRGVTTWSPHTAGEEIHPGQGGV